MKACNNRGFSYVEMIIALAIMAIMVALVSITIGTVNRNTVTRTSEKLESLVNQARVSALTKGTSKGCVSITLTDRHYYAYVGEPLSDPALIKSKGEEIAPCQYTIYFNGNEVTEGAVEQLQFKQSTGGIASGTGVIYVKNSKFESAHFSVYSETGKIKRH